MAAITHRSTAMTLRTDESATLPGSGTTASLESRCINYNTGKLFFNESHCEMFCTELLFYLGFFVGFEETFIPHHALLTFLLFSYFVEINSAKQILNHLGDLFIDVPFCCELE